MAKKYPIAVYSFYIEKFELKCYYNEWNNTDS